VGKRKFQFRNFATLLRLYCKCHHYAISYPQSKDCIANCSVSVKIVITRCGLVYKRIKITPKFRCTLQAAITLGLLRILVYYNTKPVQVDWKSLRRVFN